MNKYSKALGLILCWGFSLGSAAEEQPVSGDIVEFNCQEFKEKAKACESYTCQTPYNQDPTIKTEWKIVEKKGDRCLISNTTDDMGLKDASGKPKPITKTCEYNSVGIDNLIEQIEELQNGYYHSTADNQEGAFRCRITSNGDPVKKEPVPIPSSYD